MNTVTLLIIDPQVDFCDPNGALFVGGADKDMERLADFVTNSGEDVTDIVVTLDSHNVIDIAHPIWWVDTEGNHPNPFTIITKADVVDGKWLATNPEHQLWGESYVTQLEANNRYPLCIWPYHCIMGTVGNTISPVLNNALIDWEKNNFTVVDKFTKGTNIFTEHYSAVRADVPVANDPTTDDNMELVNRLYNSDLILVAGEALSHCVANTVLDLMTFIPASKFVLIRDAVSNVTGFEFMGDEFIEKFKNAGGGITTTKELKNAING